jgi:hypothetical protein
VSRPGYSVTVAGFNKPPSSPGRVSSQELALSNGQLTSRSGQSGGTSQQPTDNLAQSYNVGTPNSLGAPIIQTASQGRANALTVANATRQTVQQGAQIGASVATAQTVIAKILLSQVAPPAPPVTPPPVTPPPITPPVKPVPPLTYAMVTSGPFSTSPGGRSPVPYLTGAFAGSGGFTVSPILGYQSGFNSDGTPTTTSRQFQAGLSVTGKGANQNATLFVMTSAISNAPNIGFTQAGGFTGVTMRNQGNSTGWYGLANGAVSSATATPVSAPNSVPTINGIPIASFTLNNTTTNLLTGTVLKSQSYNYVQGPANYTFNPITTGTPTTLANNHPSLSLHGYVGGVMVTASGGASPPFLNYTKPYVITNYANAPGDVSISLPGNSSEMAAYFHVASVNAPTGAMVSSTYSFGSPNSSNLNGARGAYVSPSNFAARAAAVFDNGANLPVSTRSNSLLQPETTVGYANQLMVTAGSVGANTSSFLTSISSTTVKPCACESTQWGFWSAFNGANSNGQLLYEDQGALLLWVAGVPTTAHALSMATGTATYTGHAIADIANGSGGLTYLAAGTFSAAVNFSKQNGMITIGGLDGTNYAGTAAWVKGTTSFATPAGSPLMGTNGGRTAALAGSFFQGGPTNLTPAYGEIGGSLILNGNNSYLGSGIFLGRKP